MLPCCQLGSPITDLTLLMSSSWVTSVSRRLPCRSMVDALSLTDCGTSVFSLILRLSPSITVRGVRNSWVMLVKKSSRSLLASLIISMLWWRMRCT